MSLIGLLVALVILGLLYWAATRIIAAFGIGEIGEPIHTLVIVVLVIIAVLYLLGLVGYGPGLALR